jgi:hypothetical protein
MSYPSGLVVKDVVHLLQMYSDPKPSIVAHDLLMRLYANGLIDRSDNIAEITERGSCFCRHIMGLPLPVQSWYIPS